MQLLNLERSLDRAATLALPGLRRKPAVPGFSPLPARRTRLFELRQNGFRDVQAGVDQVGTVEVAVSACLWARSGELPRIDVPAHALPKPWQQ
jgi:hypothetical protein